MTCYHECATTAINVLIDVTLFRASIPTHPYPHYSQTHISTLLPHTHTHTGDTPTLQLLFFLPSDRQVISRNPATVNLSDISELDEVEGKVVRVSNYGVFIDIGAGVDAFLHRRKMKVCHVISMLSSIYPCRNLFFFFLLLFLLHRLFSLVYRTLLYFPPDTSCANAPSRSISHLSISYPPFICCFSPSDFCDAFFHFHQFFYFHSSRSFLCSHYLRNHLYSLVTPHPHATPSSSPPPPLRSNSFLLLHSIAAQQEEYDFEALGSCPFRVDSESVRTRSGCAQKENWTYHIRTGTVERHASNEGDKIE